MKLDEALVDGFVKPETEADWKKLLSDEGPLAKAIPGFQVREQQQEMLCAVGDAIKNHSPAVIEAGTGRNRTGTVLPPRDFKSYYFCFLNGN